jgi:hypothetical protein
VSTNDAGGGATVLAGATVELVVDDVGTDGTPAVVDGGVDVVGGAPLVVGPPVVAGAAPSSLHAASRAAAAAAAPCWSRRRRVIGFTG